MRLASLSLLGVTRNVWVWLLTIVVCAVVIMPRVSAAEPRAASLNLCADSLLLELARPSQIVSVSWLARDPTLSNYAERAAQHPVNHGRIEELIPLNPDYVITGSNTNSVENAILKRLGYEVVRIRPDKSLHDYKANLLQLGKLLQREEQARILIARLESNLAASGKVSSLPPAQKPLAIIFQANGYSPGYGSLANELLQYAGFRNLTTLTSNNVGGFLSLERLITDSPDLLILSSIDTTNPVLADMFLTHPALLDAHRDKAGPWHPVVIRIEERQINCGSQYIAQSIIELARAHQPIANKHYVRQ